MTAILATSPWRFFSLAAPARFYRVTRSIEPVLWALVLALTVAGLWMGFVVAPTDATQGEAYRIIFIHVPAAWLSMVLYLAMAFWAVLGWAWKVRMASMLARAIAPTGAMFTVVALWTGACWGKPTWGAWWVWDARLTSELILLFLYQGATISMTAAPKMASTMLTAMLLMTLAFWAYAFAVVFARARAIAIEREAGHHWVAQLGVLRSHP